MSPPSTAQTKPCPALADTPVKRLHWWRQLEPQWRGAFQVAFFGHVNPPQDEELEKLWQATVLRFAGPRAPYPNLNFELTNCSGLAGMRNLEVLVLTNHRLERIDELADLLRLKSLFVNNNVLQHLQGIETLTHLEQLYAQINQLESIDPIRTLSKLQEVYISFNKLTSLDGLTRKHSANLKKFFCLPNDSLTDRELMRVERTTGIRCRSL